MIIHKTIIGSLIFYALIITNVTQISKMLLTFRIGSGTLGL